MGSSGWGLGLSRIPGSQTLDPESRAQVPEGQGYPRTPNPQRPAASRQQELGGAPKPVLSASRLALGGGLFGLGLKQAVPVQQIIHRFPERDETDYQRAGEPHEEIEPMIG